MENRVRRSLSVLLFAWHLAFVTAATAADCTPQAAKIVSEQGEIEVKRAGTSNWHPVNRDDTFCPGDSIRVGEQSRAAIVMANETLLRLDQNSAIKFTQFETELPSILEFIMGIGHFISRVPRSLKIETATVDAAIEGTEFVVSTSANETSVTVFEGTVLTQNQKGEMRITDGETVIAKADAAPQKTLLAKPRNTVQWALYFPPIIETDSNNNLSRASQLLSVGRVEEAQALLQGMDSGEALALQSIIAIVNNEQERAFRLATDAVQQAPQSAATHIAMSYAWQAKLDLKQALASSQQAVEHEPNNAIAWARLAELQLSSGVLNEALTSAQQATQLNADLSRTQSILGFAYLARIDIDEAMASFNKAIELDQVDPLPRLGLGLVKIRRGKLADGRRDIEIATSLDPNNSIVRSYLGKAYFEEKRAPLDAEQYAIAKELDKYDPTPWFYDAIRLHSENRPVEALNNIQESIELNDNRAVFRSSLQLDQDEAARNASQARIFNDLAFEQLGALSGWKSVNMDPTNHSGHRLLADTYAGLPRHEIARVSELLQAQLLQPLNTTPIQPQLAVVNLGILDGTGPSDTSTTEFNPLFTRNGLNFNLNVVAGGNKTLGNDFIISGLHDRVSYNVSQYHYETDGFRENNDLTQNIYNGFVQYAVSHNTSVQAELRYNESENGDLVFRFDPEAFLDTFRVNRERTTARFGILHKPSPNTTIVGSLMSNKLKIENDLPIREESPGQITEIVLNNKVDTDGYTAELQYIGNHTNLDIVGGLGRYQEDRQDSSFSQTTIDLGFPPPIVIGPGFQSENIDSELSSAYIYSYLKLPKRLTITLGAAYAGLTSSDLDIDEVDPKLGVLWNGKTGTTVRAAYFESLARPLNAEQTIEPTQVAGFNQLFDDISGTRTKRYGVAVEQRFSRSLFAGIELTQRELREIPIKQIDGPTAFVERDEDLHRAYLYWTPNKNLAANAAYIFDQQEGDDIVIPGFRKDNLFPVGLNYFWTNGWFAGAKATYVDQEVRTQNLTGEDQFWIVDAAVGIRLPARAGIIELVGKNLFDEEFRYFDRDERTLTREPRGPVFAPSRLLLLRLSIAF